LKTLVMEGASIGANATIVCGHNIGKWAMIGAGAVVTSDVTNHALMLGIPAKQEGWACTCGEILHENFKCKSCGRRFKKDTDGLVEIQ
jgi:UDP-2-acetamido-3-amino-2,3-dideoxy-glucuronate N-acetyltransferase